MHSFHAISHVPSSDPPIAKICSAQILNEQHALFDEICVGGNPQGDS